MKRFILTFVMLLALAGLFYCAVSVDLPTEGEWEEPETDSSAENTMLLFRDIRFGDPGNTPHGFRKLRQEPAPTGG